MKKNENKILDKIISYKETFKDFPTLEYLSNYFKLPVNEMKNYLVSLHKEGVIKFNGVIIKSIDYPVDIFGAAPIEPVIKPAIQKPIVKPDKPEPVVNIVKSKIDYKLLSFKVIIFICFLIFYYLGVKNNYIGFLKSKSKLDALISAIGFFSFSIVMLECFIFYLKKKIKYLFLIVFIVMFSTNFLTILDGQYSSIKKKDNIDNNYVNVLYEKKKNIELKIKNFQDELNRQKEKPLTKNTDWFIRRLTFDDIPNAQIELDNIINEIAGVVKVEKTIMDNKYLIMFRFIVVSFAMELIASISLALLFFMRSE
jgi:hypothetical protein